VTLALLSKRIDAFAVEARKEKFFEDVILNIDVAWLELERIQVAQRKSTFKG